MKQNWVLGWSGLAVLGLMVSSVVRADEPKQALFACQSEALSSPGATGYVATFFGDSKGISAQLEKVQAGARTSLAAALACQFQNVDPAHVDQPQAILLCSDPAVVDSGYTVNFTTPDFAGRQLSVVTLRSIAGNQELDKLVCLASR